jgi:hypothetical protein
VKKGIHEHADYIFIFNGETDASDLVPSNPSTRIVRRGNTCFDLGAMGEVLREGDTWKKYKRFITMNASIRGPFLPTWSSASWSDLFLNKITEKVKASTRINPWPPLPIETNCASSWWE